MDFSNSKYLTETPDFSGVPKLERLDLSGCTYLTYVHPSIGLLEMLAFLNLRNCSNLVNINFDCESNLSSMRVLHLSGCAKLENTPDVKSATNLEYLDIDGCTSLSKVHESIGALAKLTFLSLRDCKNLVSIPKSINYLRSLQTLDLCGCSKLTVLPLPPIALKYTLLDALIVLDISFCNLVEIRGAIDELKCLERLNLQGNNFVSLPDSIKRLHCLSYLNLSHCHELGDLPDGFFLERDSRSRVIAQTSGGRYFKKVSGSRDHRSGLYAFDCPMLRNRKSPGNHIELVWLLILIQKPTSFRCGFDIVVPSCNVDGIPLWLCNKRFDGDSVIRIKQINKDDNWIGFCFCVEFELTNDGVLSSTCPHSSHPFYLSFESDDTEEYFAMPLNLEMHKIDGSKYSWIIYITRQHCHFVKTGADITFKANHPGIQIIQWGMKSIFREDVAYLEITIQLGATLGTPDEITELLLGIPERYTVEEGKKSRSGPKFQVPYNWLMTEEEEAENVSAKTKDINLSNVGL